MNSRNSQKKKIAIPSEAWEILETILACGAPDPSADLNTLVAREERRRIRDLLDLHLQPLNFRYTKE